MKKAILTLVVLLLLAPPARAADNDIWYSVVFPGWGQIRDGRYGRGTALVSAELVSLLGLVITDIQYSREVDKYESWRATYFAADYIGDKRAAFDTMNEKWNEAEDLHRYRNYFLGAAIGVWAIGVIDMAIGGEASPPPLALEARRDGFLVTRTIHF